MTVKSHDNTVPFTEEGIKVYLDDAITHWRECAPTDMRSHYVDAYQSVRVSLFGELLPIESDRAKAELKRHACEFVKKALPDASDDDIETAATKIVKNLDYLTEDS